MQDLLKDWHRWKILERTIALALVATVAFSAPVVIALETAAS